MIHYHELQIMVTNFSGWEKKSYSSNEKQIIYPISTWQ